MARDLHPPNNPSPLIGLVYTYTYIHIHMSNPRLVFAAGLSRLQPLTTDWVMYISRQSASWASSQPMASPLQPLTTDLVYTYVKAAGLSRQAARSASTQRKKHGPWPPAGRLPAPCPWRTPPAAPRPPPPQRPPPAAGTAGLGHGVGAYGPFCRQKKKRPRRERENI